jgi:hypothetical protein
MIPEDAVMCAETVYLIVTDLVRRYSSSFSLLNFVAYGVIPRTNGCNYYCTVPLCHKPYINSKRRIFVTKIDIGE